MFAACHKMYIFMISTGETEGPYHLVMFCATFISPMFLHGNSDFASLLPFFQYLHGQLLDAPSSPVFGSDDDKAQSKAIDEAFPNVKRLTCTRHLKENIQRHLWDTVGCSMADRQRIIQQIFSPKGMCQRPCHLRHRTAKCVKCGRSGKPAR